MDYRTIARIRRRADRALADREKVMLTPQQVYMLLDIACEHLDEEAAS